MKKTTFCCLLICLVFFANAQKTIIVTNSLTEQRREEVIEVPWSQITKAYPGLDTTRFKVINSTTKKELPFQLEYEGMKEVQNLLVQVSIPAKGTVTLRLVSGKPKAFPAKTFARYVPERKDDFAWENDKIAFRMYGKALESTPKEMAHGVDVWVKRTDRLILNERYKRGEYHVDHGDGMDYYHVGLTLGAGDVAPYINDTIWFSKNYRDWKVLDNGPLRSTFQLSYEEWTAASRKVKATKTISLDAGSQFNRIEIKYETNDNQPLPVVVGIIKRKEAGSMLLDEKNAVLGYWEPQHGVDGTTGVACIVTIPVSQMMVGQGQLLAETKLPATGSLVYYNGAAWDKAGQITSANDWFGHIYSFQNRVNNPLRISFK
jgi:hypothetical protein